VYSYLGWEDSTTEISTNHFLRTSVMSRACRWLTTDCMDKSRNYFALWKADTVNYLLPKDASSTVRCYGIKFGSDDDWQWLYNLYNSTASQTDRNNYINALGCSDNFVTLEWFLNVSFGNPNIPTQEFLTVYTGVAANTAAHNMVKQFFYRNWYQLIFNSSTSTGPRRVLESTFQYVNTQEELNELQAWKATAGDLGAAEGNYNALLVTINNNIAWMTTHGKEVGDWILAFDENPTLPAGCVVKRNW